MLLGESSILYSYLFLYPLLLLNSIVLLFLMHALLMITSIDDFEHFSHRFPLYALRLLWHIIKSFYYILSYKFECPQFEAKAKAASYQHSTGNKQT